MTPRQRELLAWMAEYERKHGCQPSFRDIADGIGLNTKSNAHALVRLLAEQGYVAQVVKGVERARNWRVNAAGHAALAAGGPTFDGQMASVADVTTHDLLDELRRRGLSVSVSA